MELEWQPVFTAAAVLRWPIGDKKQCPRFALASWNSSWWRLPLRCLDAVNLWAKLYDRYRLPQLRQARLVALRYRNGHGH